MTKIHLLKTPMGPRPPAPVPRGALSSRGCRVQGLIVGLFSCFQLPSSHSSHLSSTTVPPPWRGPLREGPGPAPPPAPGGGTGKGSVTGTRSLGRCRSVARNCFVRGCPRREGAGPPGGRRLTAVRGGGDTGGRPRGGAGRAPPF